MKKILLTTGIIFTGISLFAQSQHLSPFKKGKPTKHQEFVQSLLNKLHLKKQLRNLLALSKG